MDERIFISYSRQELYFAEAVTLSLEKAGLKVWFDLQQLEPGCDWQQEIQKGLEACSSVLVIASRGALSSPWVASEWMHALEANKPIYLMLFEAVPFRPVTLTTETGSLEVALDHLPEKAVAVIDGRWDFAGSCKRLIAALKGEKIRDALPTPNQLNIPTRLPLAVAFVAGALVLLTALLTIFTIKSISINIPLALANGIITVWAGNRTWVFIQRRSYREGRILLMVASLLSCVFALWATPIFLIATILAMSAPDIHRYSPLAQGLERGRSNPIAHTRRKQVYGIWNNLAVGYGRLNGFIKAFIVVFSALGILIGLSFLNSRVSGGYVLCAPAGILIIVLHFVLRGRYRNLVNEGLGQADQSGLTYDIVYADPVDANLADKVNLAMISAGHRRPTGRFSISNPETAPNIIIIILTDNIETRVLNQYKDYPGRLIFLVSSALTDWERFRPFARYQWVDWRRQMPGVIENMAEDILIFGSDIVSHSFGTRQTPQSFDKVLLPGRVAAYLLLQYILIDINLFFFARSIVSGNANAFSEVMLLLTIPSFLLGIWLINRIICREITISDLLNINIAVSVVSYGIGFVIGLAQPLPAGYVRNYSGLPLLCAVQVVELVIGYFVARSILRTVLGGWLPNFVLFIPRFPSFRRDRALWRSNLISAAVTVMFTLVFTGQPVAAAAEPDDPQSPSSAVDHVQLYQNMIAMDVPQHWQNNSNPKPTPTKDAPIAAIVRVGFSPLSQDIANGLTSIFLGNAGTAYTPYMASPDSTLAYTIQNQFNSRQVTKVYQGRFIPNSTTAGLGVSVWAVKNGFTYYITPQSLLSSVQSAARTQINKQEMNLDSTTTLYDQTYSEKGYSYTDIPQITSRVLIYDTRSVDFVMIISGDEGTMESEKDRVDAFIKSVKFDVPLAPTPAPTLPPRPTRTPYPTFAPRTPLPTLAPVHVDFDGFGFQSPAGWVTASISDLNKPISWAGGRTVLSVLPILRNFERDGKTALHVKWAGTYVDLYSQPLIIVSVAEYDPKAGKTVFQNEKSDGFLDSIQKVVKGSLYSKTIRDKMLVDNKDLYVHQTIIDTQQPGYLAVEEWYVAVDTADSHYVIWVLGIRSNMILQANKLDGWIQSFEASEHTTR